MGNFDGKMEENMKESGVEENKMAREYIEMEKVKRKEDNGPRVKEYNG